MGIVFSYSMIIELRICTLNKVTIKEKVYWVNLDETKESYFVDGVLPPEGVTFERLSVPIDSKVRWAVGWCGGNLFRDSASWKPQVSASSFSKCA